MVKFKNGDKVIIAQTAFPFGVSLVSKDPLAFAGKTGIVRKVFSDSVLFEFDTPPKPHLKYLNIPFEYLELCHNKTNIP